MTKVALASLVVLAGLGFGQAFAATSEDIDVDADQMKCEFVADAGGYVCQAPQLHGSLSEPQEENAKKKLLWWPKHIKI